MEKNLQTEKQIHVLQLLLLVMSMNFLIMLVVVCAHMPLVGPICILSLVVF